MFWVGRVFHPPFRVSCVFSLRRFNAQRPTSNSQCRRLPPFHQQPRSAAEAFGVGRWALGIGCLRRRHSRRLNRYRVSYPEHRPSLAHASEMGAVLCRVCRVEYPARRVGYPPYPMHANRLLHGIGFIAENGMTPALHRAGHRGPKAPQQASPSVHRGPTARQQASPGQARDERRPGSRNQ